MPNPRFFKAQGPFKLSDLAKIGGCEVVRGLGETLFENVASLDDAKGDDLSFLSNRKYIQALEKTEAGAVIVEPTFIDRVPEHCAILTSEMPYRAFAQISAYFYPDVKLNSGIDPTAVIDENAILADTVTVGAHAVIHAGAEIGDGVVIGPNAVVDFNVKIGANTLVGANAYLGYCVVGQRCEIHPGARIGTRGFGFAMDKRGYIDVPQIGGVIIGDAVEIGANSTVDRGAGPDTVIGDGTKIDNLVQIGHNVKIGKGCVIIAQTGIAGSTVLEDYVICAAKAGIAGHLTIGTGAQIAAMSGVMRNVPAGQKVGGAPAVPFKQWMRQNVALEKLVKKKERKDYE